MIKKAWRGEPVAVLATILIVVMLVQKLWLGEVITQEWILWVINLFGVATGAGVLRANVYSKKTVEDEDNGIEAR